MKFRKKPVVIEAITFDELVAYGSEHCGSRGANSVPWSFDYKGQPITHETDDCYLIPTLEGTMRFDRGDMLITGVKGEIYPCKADIFAATYEPAADALSALEGQAALDEANGMIVRLRDALRDVLSLIADEDSGDGKGELIRDTSRDDAPDYALRMMRLVKIIAAATALAGSDEGGR